MRSNRRGTTSVRIPETRALVQEPQHDVVRRVRERDHDELDVVLGDHRLEIPARADHRDRQRRAVSRRERILVEEADGLQTELGVIEEPSGRQDPDEARADDDRGGAELASHAVTHDVLRPADATRDQCRPRAEPDDERVVGARLVDAYEGLHGDPGHRADGRRRDEEPRILQDVELRLRCVTPSNGEHAERDQIEDDQ